jgi:broad specificity phosphatase PhoE
MTTFFLIRHGEADYSHPAKWNAPGWGADLAPLTARGIEQIRDLVPRLRAIAPDGLLSSPTTRALQGALIVQQAVSLEATVEFDLHEWVPDRTFNWRTLEQVNSLYADLEANGGEWPTGEKCPWEPLSAVRTRARDVLRKYEAFERVVVMCHGILIRSLTGQKSVANGQILEYRLPPG